MGCRSGYLRTLNVRKATESEPKLKVFYEALGLNPLPVGAGNGRLSHHPTLKTSRVVTLGENKCCNFIFFSVFWVWR